MMKSPSIQQMKHRVCGMSPIRKDVVWTFVTQIVTMISAFVVTKLVSNLFSIEEFGVYNVVRRSASVLSFVM